ncbi:uncharacterized protein LOC129223201 [Uloborus diversus]|uniref:uncharacterized protein LOC129223201 n=1 Tax=Uloborus diversus TaxID=327109 RepID=UPI00240A0860|nr:uncharacterized protein LOC129223201 [Uloborus diversus]
MLPWLSAGQLCRRAPPAHSNLHQFILPLTITESNDDSTINIYTDGSKTDAGTACAFIALKEINIIFSSSKTLRPNNSVFQAEIQAIHLAIDWIQDHFSMDHFTNNKFHIRSDSLSAIKALLNYEPKSMVIFQLQSKLINLRHIVTISWIKGHSNNSGNDFAAQLAKDATNSATDLINPFPMSQLNKDTNEFLLKDWQSYWDHSSNGRWTYDFLNTVSLSRLQSSPLNQFTTNHGLTHSYLYTRNLLESPYCICGELGDFEHFFFHCRFTSNFHVVISSNLKAQWKRFIFIDKEACRKALSLINFLFQNKQLLFPALS